MLSESEYGKIVSSEKRKQLGQFFTPEQIARFMVKWISNCKDILDPALGNNIFYRVSTKQFDSYTGYEIDPEILSYFQVSGIDLKCEDYLLASWGKKFDGIICNPPYNRFQNIPNRQQIYKVFKEQTGIELTHYTNEYVLFLIKSLYQLADGGRLVYIVPHEFLNSKYGAQIKDILINHHYLRAIINIDSNVFSDVLTTCCILFVDTDEKSAVEFITVDDPDKLNYLTPDKPQFSENSRFVPYDILINSDKWLSFLENEPSQEYVNLTKFSTFCEIHRGIATGDNEYFVFNRMKLKKHNLSEDAVKRCICSSKDSDYCIFTEKDFEILRQTNKNCYVLNLKKDTEDPNELAYIQQGLESGVNKKYLPAHRKPWFICESQTPADIWIGSAARGGIRVVFNDSKIYNMTTFHGIYMNSDSVQYAHTLFCYLLTPIAQEILSKNKKKLGNGLDKYQPSDYRGAEVLDFRTLTSDDIQWIEGRYMDLYKEKENVKEIVSELNSFFKSKI